MSQVSDGSLYSILARLPDARKARGKLYPLPSLLTMTVAAILCGCKTLIRIENSKIRRKHCFASHSPTLDFRHPT
jgi:hypothetical protein